MEQTTTLTEFAKDILDGLSSDQKYLSSKYFYDDKGNKIFQDIMQMPEYYLTECELEIFNTSKQAILNDFSAEQAHFELVELGAGDGLKTKVLLSYFLSKNIDFKYSPIDISEDAVKNLISDLKNEIPELKVNGLIGDYFDLIKDIKVNGYSKKIVLFLGSNIGNYNWQKSLEFFKYLRHALNPQDQLFIGFDLKKDPNIILKAYNDPHGHTSAFNLNLLNRINQELNANFNLTKFKHQEVYNPQTGTAKSFLKSLKKQEVEIQDLGEIISFEEGELIFMEMSQKYDMEMILELAKISGFEIVRNFYDQRQYFVNSLWKLKI